MPALFFQVLVSLVSYSVSLYNNTNTVFRSIPDFPSLGAQSANSMAGYGLFDDEIPSYEQLTSSLSIRSPKKFTPGM